MHVAFQALLDACVLYPVVVRDLLLSVAERLVYAPHCSEAILDEMVRNVVADGRSTAEKMTVMRQQMAVAFPDACIEGYEALVPVMTNHPKARHVLAAAAAYRPYSYAALDSIRWECRQDEPETCRDDHGGAERLNTPGPDEDP